MKKNKANYILFLLVFLGIGIYMIIINMNQKTNLELQIPNNRGVLNLTSNKQSLIVQEIGGNFYIFNWNQLQEKYQTISTNTDQALLTQDMDILTVEKGRKIAMLSDDRTVFTIPLFEKCDSLMLEKNSLDSMFVTARKFTKEDIVQYRIEQVDTDRQKLKLCFMSEGNLDFVIRTIQTANADSTVYIAGAKDKKAYLAAINIEKKILLWERQYSNEEMYYCVAVSGQDNYLLAGSHLGYVYKIDAESGDVLTRILLVPKPRKNTNYRFIQNIKISPDEKIFAASCDPKVYIVELKDFQLKKELSVGHKIVSGMAFSPDVSQLATADLRASGFIEIHDLLEE